MTTEQRKETETQKKGNKPARPSKREEKKSLSAQNPIKKEKEVLKKLIECETNTAGLKDRLLRTAAELDNIRKRTEKEIVQVIQNANAGLIKDLLPVVDDFERSLKVSEPMEGNGFRKGAEMIYQKLMAVLKQNGLEPMESIGKSFDVEIHDALLHMERKDASPGIIIEEQSKGYYLNEKVLRHAKVVVSK
jgi:molecular chaperone GrpE